MKLIDLLVRELPKRGGWPDGAECAVQDADYQLCFSSHSEVSINNKKTDWLDGQWSGGWSNPYLDDVADDRDSSIVTRDQYQSALAASQKVEWSGDGLPPVGCNVEYIPGMLGPASSDDNKPIVPTIIKVVAHEQYPNGGNDVVVGIWMAKSGGMRSSVFSPRCLVNIRSEADKRRDAAVEAIDYWLPEFIPGTPNEFYHAKKIYDAIASGKIPGVKLED